MSVKLSICISTFNRAAFIGRTLGSVAEQATNDCEIVIVDGGSTDNTESVVSEYAHRLNRLRYVKLDKNNGVDRDFDRAVELACGEYCWLFSDDDLLKPGAVATVLDALRRNYSLVLVNGEHRDFSMSEVRIPNFFGIQTDRVYVAGEEERLFIELGRCLICICCVVIRRSIWLQRERERFYGSRFVHFGVIFQSPLPGGVLAISKPLMSLRLGNAQTHGKEAFSVWFIKLPSLVWSLPFSTAAKEAFCIAEPWRNLGYLLALRGHGIYTSAEYRLLVRPALRWWFQAVVHALVACLPCKLAFHVYAAHSLIKGLQPDASRRPWRTMFPESWNRYADDLTRVSDGK